MHETAIFPLPAVYQRIFNQLIQILYQLVDSDHFNENHMNGDSAVNSCKITVH